MQSRQKKGAAGHKVLTNIVSQSLLVNIITDLINEYYSDNVWGQ